MFYFNYLADALLKAQNPYGKWLAYETFQNLKKKIFKRIYESRREEELRKKWDYFANHKLILTDRLHGMIFAAITGTPCIAFDNCSRKVSGVYEWIKNIGYIWIVHSPEEAARIADEVCQSKDIVRYSKKKLEQKFDILAEIIR